MQKARLDRLQPNASCTFIARERSDARSNAARASVNGKVAVISGFTLTKLLGEQLGRQSKLLVEAEGAAQLEFLGNDDVQRQRGRSADADLDENTAGLHHIESGNKRLLASRRFHQNIEAALVVGIGCERVLVARDVDEAVGAELTHELAGRIRHIRRHHLDGAGASNCNGAQRADRTRAGNQHAPSEQGTRAAGRMQADGERLGHGRFGSGQRGRHDMALCGIRHQDLTEGALHVRHAHGAAVEAHIEAVDLLPGLTKAASSAWPARRYRDAVTGFDAIDLRADLVHYACNLMAEDHRLLQQNRADAPLVVVVKVRAADTAGFDAHADIAWTRCRQCDLVDAQVFGGMNDDGTHSNFAPEVPEATLA